MIDGKKIIALCTYGISDPQVFSYITELNEFLKAKNCRLFVYTLNTEIGNGGDFYNAESSVFDLIPFRATDAIVIMDERIKSRTVVQRVIDKAAKYNIPCILVDGDYENTSTIKFDYAQGFEAVVRHVIEHHKVNRPHFMAGKKDSIFSNERLEVFKKVITENGFTFDDSMVSYGEFWSVPSRAAAAKLLKRDVKPDAIICANDIMAINVTDVFASAGYRVPQDLIVTGFDGIDEAFISTPGITTAICDSHTLATTVANTIFDALAGERNMVRWIVPSFIANESCGCPRVDMTSLTSVHELNNRFYHHQDDIHVLQNLTAIMMCSNKMRDCITHIRHSLAESFCCVVDDALFDVERNYFLDDIKSDTMSILYNSLSDSDDAVQFDKDTILPYLDELLEKGYPLIFNAMEYMGKSIGFVCFTFEGYDLIDYSKTASITNCLSMGIGGFVTMRYQDYLRNRLQAMYKNDALTGLYNRIAFLTKFNELKNDPRMKGQTLTIIMSDLNGLKKINDNLGHSAGDRAIAAVARALKNTCPTDSLCVRFGGDEMLAVIPGECNEDALINSMQEQLARDSEILGFKVSASYGSYSTQLSELLDLDKLIGIADKQMYLMKKESH